MGDGLTVMLDGKLGEGRMVRPGIGVGTAGSGVLTNHHTPSESIARPMQHNTTNITTTIQGSPIRCKASRIVRILFQQVSE